MLVDGYNIIFSWEGTEQISSTELSGYREQLKEMLSNYQGAKGIHVILVFDAYKVENGTGSIEKYDNIDVVFTKEAETADQYIERVTNEIAKEKQVIVATSDLLEQTIILGHGAVRWSSREFMEELAMTNREIRMYLQQKEEETNRLLSYLSQEDAESIERIRQGKNEV